MILVLTAKRQPRGKERDNLKKLTGHLEEKNGRYYAAVNHYSSDGKRHVKWYNLDVEAKKGNKRKDHP